MIKTLACCALSAVVASIVTWCIVGSHVAPDDVMDTAGSRSLGDPWPTPEWFHREENVFSPAEQKVLNSAQQFTIFALNPGGRPTEGEEVAGEFHGFPILGQAEIRNPAERAACCTHCITGSTIPTAMPPLVSIRATVSELLQTVKP